VEQAIDLFACWRALPGSTSTGVCPPWEASLWPWWKMCWTSTKRSTTPVTRPSAWM